MRTLMKHKSVQVNCKGKAHLFWWDLSIVVGVNSEELTLGWAHAQRGCVKRKYLGVRNELKVEVKQQDLKD